MEEHEMSPAAGDTSPGRPRSVRRRSLRTDSVVRAWWCSPWSLHLRSSMCGDASEPPCCRGQDRPKRRPQSCLTSLSMALRSTPAVWNTCHWWGDEGCTISSNDELEWYRPEQVSVVGRRTTADRRSNPDAWIRRQGLRVSLRHGDDGTVRFGGHARQGLVDVRHRRGPASSAGWPWALAGALDVAARPGVQA